MKLEVEIKVYDNDRYGAKFVERTLSIEADIMPAALCGLVSDLTADAINEATKKVEKEDKPTAPPREEPL